MSCLGIGFSAKTVWGWGAICGLTAALALGGMQTATAQTYLPSIKIGTAALISPVSANTYYYSKTGWTDTNSTDGLGGITGTPTPTPPEIVALAAALKNDPDLIYQYVHNNIQIVWMYGLQKGALGASIDKSGTPFDQAELMVALLRQAGKTVSYVAGTIQLSQPQFNAWTGITNARAACQLLANGGIPATVNGVNNAACSTINSAFNVSTVEMAHIWVKVTMPGCSPSAFCVFDPSYKAYTWKTGIPLAAAMAMRPPGQTLTNALIGSASGSDSAGGGLPVNYIQTVNAANLNADLQSYASSLLTYIQSHNMQGSQIEDIVGGGVIVPDNTSVRQATLPYADPTPPYVFHTWTPGSDPARYNAVPDQYRTVLTVEAQAQEYNDPCCDTHTVEMFNPTPLFVDEIYGRRLSIETNFTAAGIGIQNDYYVQNTCLALDVQPWNTWPAAQCLKTYSYDPPDILQPRTLPASVILSATHPYAASADGTATTHGDYMTATVTKPVKLLTSLAIVHGWGDSSAALFNKWSGERAADSILPVLNTAPMCPGGEGGEGDPCPLFYLQPTGGYAREKTAGAWLAQFSRAAKLNAAMANAVPQIHHTLGVIYGEAGTSGVLVNQTQLSGTIVADNFDRIDVDAGISVTAKTSSTAATNARRGAIMTMAASSAALEGSISGQLQDVVDTSSTATRFEWGNTPDSDHSSTGQNPFTMGPQKFYQYDLSNYGEAAGAPGLKGNGLSRVDGDISGSCNGISPINWNLPPSLTGGACYGIAASGGNPAVEGLTNRLGDWIGSYALAGFTVVASSEAYLGPGQRGGQIFPNYGLLGRPTTYTFALSKQRGGAFVALKVDTNGDPTEIAHIIIGGGKDISKGGGGSSQPDDKTTYDPATAGEILKSRFVDRSKLLGVDLANGSLGTTSPVSIGIGNGGFPYELSAGLSWHAAPSPEGFSPVSPIAPQAGWTNSWLNSMSFSGSGMEAMGQSDIRGAIGAIVSFYAAQDIYQATESAGREVAGVLTQSWWTHQLSGNVATVNVGGNARQFVKIATGDWIEPGAGYATAVQTNARVPYEDKCYHASLEQTPYAPSRGWDSSNVLFAVTNAQGDVENFGYFMNPYYVDDVHQCGKLKGFRLTSWTFPQNVSITPTYTPITVGDDQLDALSAISNSVGRSLAFTPTTVTAGARHISFSDASTQPLSMTDAMGKATSYTYRPPQPLSATMRPVPYALLASVTTPENTAQHNTEYYYDSLGRMDHVLDAVAIQQGTRGPYQFHLADGTRGERDDPLGQPYSVVYDTYGHASRYIDELGHETDALFDSRGRAQSYTYPEGDCEVFAYDDHNNTTDFWKVDETSSCNTAAGSTHVLHASAVWDQTWNKPTSVTNARGFVTTLLYYPTGSATGSVSLVQTATRPQIDINGVPTSPIYTFTYDGAGKLVDLTSPTTTGQSGIVTHHTYQTNEDPKNTVVDYSTGTGHLNLTTQFLLDTDGNLTTVTDPRGNATTSIWDADRRKAEDDHHDGGSTAALNAASKTLYDAIGRVTDDQVASAIVGSTVTWLTVKHTTYTPTSKVATVTDADSRVITTTYDNGDRISKATDPAANTTHFVYCTTNLLPDCAANQVSKEIRAWDNAHANACAVSGTLQECYRRVTYGGDGEELTIKDANGNITTYSYDGWNRLNDTAFPDTTHEHLTPDENGNITKRITRAGQELDYTYNALDWMSQKVMPVPPTSSLTTTWAYLLDGRVDVINDTAGFKIDYGYDTAGRMNQVANRIDGFGADRTVNYTLDNNGNRTLLQWPIQDAAYSVGYCYDSLNRMTQAVDNPTGSGCAANLLATYAYDAQSRRTSVTYGNGASMSYTSYSTAGDLKTLNENFTGSSNNNAFIYDYTPAHQTMTIAASNAAFFWQPPVNNSTAYTVNNLNQYPTIGTQTTGGTNCQGAAQGLSYDCNGNLTFDGNFTYSYDAENRLLKASNATVTAKYEYDPLGRRTKKAITGVATTFFLSDGTDEIAEYNGSNSVVTRYIPGPGIDEPIAVQNVSTGAKEYFHADKQGSVVATSDGATGNLVEGPFTYDPYGNCFVSLTACSAIIGEPYRFTGRRYDTETGLYYYRARYYDPAKGRFLQTDAVGYDVDLNMYLYANNDPANRLDPTGADFNCTFADSRIGAASDSICGGSIDPDHPNAQAGSPSNSRTHHVATSTAADAPATSPDIDVPTIPGISDANDDTSCTQCVQIAGDLPHANDNIKPLSTCHVAIQNCVENIAKQYGLSREGLTNKDRIRRVTECQVLGGLCASYDKVRWSGPQKEDVYFNFPDMKTVVKFPPYGAPVFVPKSSVPPGPKNFVLPPPK